MIIRYQYLTQTRFLTKKVLNSPPVVRFWIYVPINSDKLHVPYLLLCPLSLRKMVRCEQECSSCYCLTVMEAVSMYHVYSFHKRLQTQLIPFRLGILKERKKCDWDEFSHTVHTSGEEEIKDIYTSFIKPSNNGKKQDPCRCAKATNHQFHKEPITVPKTRAMSIQAFLIPFGAFGALKGLMVPSSALL